MTTQKKGAESLWERLARPAPTPRTALSPQRLAVAAVALADAEGLEAVTMRRLASGLGVAPMAAYRYVSGKEDLLQLMIDQVYGELEFPENVTGWREAMRALALGTRALMLRHPWLGRLSSPQSVLALTPNRMAVAERALTALDGLGLDADTAMSVFRTVGAYAYGTAHAEVAWLQLLEGEGWGGGDDARLGMAPQMIWLMGTGRYPHFQRYLTEAGRKDDPQWQFDNGLEAVLDGIAARLGI
ncbi:TetR/AcrR family transcriptional regulator [Streptomyces sp. NBC_01142]|uniref:TetR/AcrR family transcriptional regulator n=1 Tax=Streptomyces sp. NBC_01142 TaxID=2975865 RepID=UPI002259D21B|nr:TetR/AcrR family transcriptional regulator [Streptomyces sp. NBC_01142]MCX4824173.1 TetR/AcrR family transcriptional regulator [Streptomyces sp. NBC_01142]